MDRLSTGEKVAGGSALVLLLLSFFPLWAKFEAEVTGFGGSSARFGGWSAATPFYTKLAFALALIALALVVIRAAALDVQLPFAQGMSLLVLGGLATVLLLITLLAGPVGDQGSSDFGGATFEYSRGLAMLIGWLVAAGIAAGGYLHMQDESSTGAVGPPPEPPGGGASPGASPGAPGSATGAPGTTPPPGGGPTPPPA